MKIFILSFSIIYLILKKDLVRTLLLLSVILVCYACARESKPEFGNDPKAGMVLIPEGKFSMGGKSKMAYPDEFPQHEVKISAFYMDEKEVTNREFAKFVDETGYITVAERDVNWEEMKKQVPPGTPKPADSLLLAGSLVFIPTSEAVDLRDESQWWKWTTGANWFHPEGPGSDIKFRMDHPVVHIAHIDALAYATWAGKRLPTEAEWEWAALGGEKRALYAWGNRAIDYASDRANFWQGPFPYQNEIEDGYEGTAPVMSFPPNGYGLYDMSGNVWEWCADKYDINYYSKLAKEGLTMDPKGAERSNDPTEPYMEKYVLRGGSFLCSEDYCTGYRVSRRMRSSPDSGFNHTGFRCAMDYAD